jgi:HAMP domain-containing protein
LTGRNGELLGALLVGSSRRDLVLLTRHIVKLSAAVAAAAILIGLLLTWWVSARITRPIEELVEGARDVAAGHWDTRIHLTGRDETGQLASAFNHMTQTLATQRERLVQTERVAAWRELARRLAHELRNPLFPLQITVENMQCAATESRPISRGLQRIDSDPEGRAGQSQFHSQPLQRFLQNAIAGIFACGYQ